MASMVKYSEDQLIELRQNGIVPNGVDLKLFSEMISSVKEKLEKNEANENDNPKFTFRRRSSRNETRPYFKKNFRKHEHVITQPDADGWVTLKTPRKSMNNDDNRDEVRDYLNNSTTTPISPVMKMNTKTKHLGSRVNNDAREAAADITTKKYNAFSALVSDDEDDSE